MQICKVNECQEKRRKIKWIFHRERIRNIVTLQPARCARTWKMLKITYGNKRSHNTPHIIILINYLSNACRCLPKRNTLSLLYMCAIKCIRLAWHSCSKTQNTLHLAPYFSLLAPTPAFPRLSVAFEHVYVAAKKNKTKFKSSLFESE